ncbi:uncharacterized protein LOC6582964 isoform X1 [Drosophila mojavensis]|uniref:Uncharacterized protein, isoform C n=1 Tax=Drosophila mojavensis TaxID=7230 RepID=A0A0Q9XFN9_DROMO|nr:uncharacterized protein LOC6582964 isoform X1 [Drosophila mojavensis]KRG06505.1 uncharacterized protein Dmoj_GI13605, isoform C [Drosophila mojavensis]
MWAFKTVIPFETAVKLHPQCRKWPTVCWLFLKIYGMFKYAILDQNRFFWIELGCIISCLLFIKWWLWLRNTKQRLEQAVIDERKLNQLHFEESLGELLLAAKLKADKQEEEQSDNLSMMDTARDSNSDMLVDTSTPRTETGNESQASSSSNSLCPTTRYIQTNKKKSAPIKRKHPVPETMAVPKKSPKWRL